MQTLAQTTSGTTSTSSMSIWIGLCYSRRDRMDFMVGAAVPVPIDELRMVTLHVGYGPPYPESTGTLLSEIDFCERARELYLSKISSIPPEIENCRYLNSLYLEECMDEIELPQRIVLNGLELVMISYGDWIKDMILALLTFLAECAPNFNEFVVFKDKLSVILPKKIRDLVCIIFDQFTKI